jgi:trypsin
MIWSLLLIVLLSNVSKTDQSKWIDQNRSLLPVESVATPRTQSSEGRILVIVKNIFNRSDFQTRIVGGGPADAGAYPFFAHATDDELCGGTLIYPDIILTAAHCIGAYTSEMGTDVSVIIGSNDLFGRDGAERVTVDFVFPHPDYSPGTEENDIMLVKLASLSSAPLVTLNTDPNLPLDGQAVTVIGFGFTSDGGDVSEELLEVEVEAIGFVDCNAQLPGSIFEETHICAGVAEGGKDSCSGDSGGPLLDSAATVLQYGLVSFGVGCAQPNTPGVYTRVSAYRDWIQSFICNNSTRPPQTCDIDVGASESPSGFPSDAPSQDPTPQTGTSSGFPSLIPTTSSETSKPPFGSSLSPTRSSEASEAPTGAPTGTSPGASASGFPSLSPTNDLDVGTSEAPSGFLSDIPSQDLTSPTASIIPSLSPTLRPQTQSFPPTENPSGSQTAPTLPPTTSQPKPGSSNRKPKKVPKSKTSQVGIVHNRKKRRQKRRHNNIFKKSRKQRRPRHRHKRKGSQKLKEPTVSAFPTAVKGMQKNYMSIFDKSMNDKPMTDTSMQDKTMKNKSMKGMKTKDKSMKGKSNKKSMQGRLNEKPMKNKSSKKPMQGRMSSKANKRWGIWHFPRYFSR